MKKTLYTLNHSDQKKHIKKLLPLLCAGCIVLSGCGNANSDSKTANVTVQEETTAAEDSSTASTTAEETNSPETSKDFSVVGGGQSISETPSADTTSSTTPPATTKPQQTLTPTTTAERRSVTGIITDASQYFVAFQTQDGKSHYLSIPETGLEGGLDYVTIGQFATLNYIGTLDESHAVLTSVTPSYMTTDIYLEEYAFAIEIINAVKAMDLEYLSDLSKFPLFIDTGNYNGVINTPGEFEAIDNEKIFTEALIERIANYNLFNLKYSDSGFHFGNGGPNITFDVDDEGILNIIGITSVYPDENTK